MPSRNDNRGAQHLSLVRRIDQNIESSSTWKKMDRDPSAVTTEELLPKNWLLAWRQSEGMFNTTYFITSS
jgi:hypothetical protein